MLACVQADGDSWETAYVRCSTGLLHWMYTCQVALQLRLVCAPIDRQSMARTSRRHDELMHRLTQIVYLCRAG